MINVECTETSGDRAPRVPCLAMMARTDVTIVSLPLNQVALSDACWYGVDWHCESQFAGGCKWGFLQVDPES